MVKTDTLIRNEGMEALVSKLGYVDAERFIMLIRKEPFDYTAWRQNNLPQDIAVRELSNRAMKEIGENE